MREEERAAAERCWSRLRRLYSVAAGCVHARPAQQLAAKAAGPRVASEPRGAPAEVAELATTYVGKVVEHAIAVDEKISQLNAAWPSVIAKYEAQVRGEMRDPERFHRRYASIAYGDLD